MRRSGNRYAMKRKHIRKEKQLFANQTWNGRRTIHELEDYYRARIEDPWCRRWYTDRNNGFAYWQKCYLSGCRKLAKDATNRKIRAMYRGMMANMDPDDVPALMQADYEKVFDYQYTLW